MSYRGECSEEEQEIYRDFATVATRDAGYDQSSSDCEKKDGIVARFYLRPNKWRWHPTHIDAFCVPSERRCMITADIVSKDKKLVKERLKEMEFQDEHFIIYSPCHLSRQHGHGEVGEIHNHVECISEGRITHQRIIRDLIGIAKEAENAEVP